MTTRGIQSIDTYFSLPEISCVHSSRNASFTIVEVVRGATRSVLIVGDDGLRGSFDDWSLSAMPNSVSMSPRGERAYAVVSDERNQDQLVEMRADGSATVLSALPQGSHILGVTPPDDDIFIVDSRLDVYRVGHETGKITACYWPAVLSTSHAGLSPYGRFAAYRSPVSESLSGVQLVDRRTGEEWVAMEDTGAETICWLTEKAVLVEHGETNARGIYDLQTKSVSWPISPGVGESIVGTWQDDMVVFFDDYGQFSIYDFDGQRRGVFNPEDGRVHTDIKRGLCRVAPTNRGLFYARAYTYRPDVLVRYDRDGDRSSTVYQPDFPDFSLVDFSCPEQHSFTGADGSSLDAFVHRYGETAPTLVFAYGGLSGSEYLQTRFKPHEQWFVAAGYNVARVDQSGVEYSAEDIAQARDWLAQHDWVDEESMAIIGHSHGGYDALIQLAQYPHKWACGVARSSRTRSDLIARYSDLPVSRDRIPVNIADQISVPVCLTHGTKDSNTPVEESRAMRDALIDAGFVEDRNLRYAEFDGGHVIRNHSEAVAEWQTIAEFLRHNLQQNGRV